jgi:hypothetical protein
MDFTVHKFVKEESESEEDIQTEFHLSQSFNGTDDLAEDVKPVVGLRDVLLGVVKNASGIAPPYPMMTCGISCLLSPQKTRAG